MTGPGPRQGRRWAAAAAALALLLPLAGCGGDPEDTYCTALQADRKQMAAMVDSTSPTALLSNLPMLEDLAAQAPPDLVDEWQAFLRPVKGLDKALKDAGVKASDFREGKPPAGLTAAQRTSISEAAGQLGDDDVVQGAAGIDQQARDVCKINLGL